MPTARFSGRSACAGSAMITPTGNPIASPATTSGTTPTPAPSATRQTGVALVGRDHPRHATVGPAELGEEPLRGGEDPGALRGVRVDDHGQQLERGGPLGHGAGLATEGGELDVGVDLGDHGVER